MVVELGLGLQLDEGLYLWVSKEDVAEIMSTYFLVPQCWVLAH